MSRCESQHKLIATEIRLMDEETQNERIMPYCLLSDHTLPITDLVCGVGLFPECRILTSSVDHSVKVMIFSTPSSTS